MVDLEAARSALLEADREWANAYQASESPADAFVNAVTDDASLLPPGAPLAEGKEAIRSVIEALESAPGFAVQWEARSAGVSEDASLGYTIGTYSMTMQGPDGQVGKTDGKYTTIWRKQADGSWKVVVDMFNASGPPAPVPHEG